MSWWPDVLAPRPASRAGQLLASHPRAAEFRASLTRDLSVEKLVRVANCVYNYTSRDIDRKLGSPNRERESRRAWNELRLKMRESGSAGGGKWAQTVHLLTDELADEALAQIKDLDVARLMTVCQRIVTGPYRQATKASTTATVTSRPSTRTAIRRSVSSRRLPRSEPRQVSQLPASRLEWARECFDELGVRGESEEYLIGVERWRATWRPPKVKALLVAESHVAQAVGDGQVQVQVDSELNARALPSVYVRLVYCLGYGNDDVCVPAPPANNDGTGDFWEIFECVVTAGERHAGLPLPTGKTERQLAILERLVERGIWLEDASVVGLYQPGGGRLTTHEPSRKVILQEGWTGYVWPALAADPPEHVWVIGRTVQTALHGLRGIRGSRCIMQPSYARRKQYEGMWEQYQTELKWMAGQLAGDAP
jgi:hypothetical protein